MESQQNNICFCPCKWEDIEEMVIDYLEENQIVIDAFWEEHLLASNHYQIMCGKKVTGYFSIHGGSTIVLFNVSPQVGNVSQELFSKVKKYENVTKAMVITGDELFLSHCIDNFSRIEKQAYFSIYTDKEIPKEREIPLQLSEAKIDRDEKILKLSGDFLNQEIKKLQKGLDYLKIYIVKQNEDIVGFGVIEYGRVLKDRASIGMYVCEEYRCQGIAANILQKLKHIVQEKGYKAFSGCWYYNHNSKKSMESAGAYSKTRLINFYF